jgi:hypothetical protein
MSEAFLNGDTPTCSTPFKATNDLEAGKDWRRVVDPEQLKALLNQFITVRENVRKNRHREALILDCQRLSRGIIERLSRLTSQATID